MSKAIRVHHGSFGRVAVLELSRSLVAHAHAQAHVLIKIGGADAHFAVGDEHVPITDGNAVLVTSWESHAYHHPNADDHVLVLALHLDPLWVAATVPGWQSGGRFARHSQPASEALLEAARALSGDVIFDGADPKDIDRSVLDLLRRVHVADAGRVDPTTVDRRIARCVTYMREHLEQREDLSVVASRFGLSRAHLFYLFQCIYAVTPGIYWNTLRMEYAIEALHSSDSSIGGIAFDLGFASQSNFTRFFQNIQGVSPRGYRIAAMPPVARSGSPTPAYSNPSDRW